MINLLNPTEEGVISIQPTDDVDICPFKMPDDDNDWRAIAHFSQKHRGRANLYMWLYDVEGVDCTERDERTDKIVLEWRVKVVP